MLSLDLADLYGTSTGALIQAVKRNRKRFPNDFMFRLTADEKAEVITICDNPTKLKFSPSLPLAFTEQGVAMLSSVLKSERAIQVNIAIMRVFSRIRELLIRREDLAAKLAELEGRVDKHDTNIIAIFDAIKRLIDPKKPRPRIGFKPKR